VRIGTRGSALALAQAGWVAARLGGEVVVIATSGDRGRTDGDKSRWVDALERALLTGEIDLAVHSAKDVPAALAEGTMLVAATPREDPRDVLVGPAGLGALGPGARVGTSALRRRAQVLAVRPDLEVIELRGNVDTRLRKLAAGEADALVLAAAGLARLGRAPGTPLVGEAFVPAPGQGTLALQAREPLPGLAAVHDEPAWLCLRAERALVHGLDATCRTPVGAHARLDGEGLRLAGFAGLPDGAAWVRDELAGAAADPEGLGRAVAERMLAAGAGELLARAEALAT